jgi:phospho-N-acetylmuramoyl-pentapeptide-transferase
MILYQNVITFSLIATIFAGIIAVPVIALLYRFKVVRRIEVDFSTLIEGRKEKYGTPIMGGLIFIIAILVTNYIFNYNIYTRIPLHLFAAAGLLGAADDLLNIFGRSRRIKTVDRVMTLIKVHKNPLMRLWYIITFPWYLFMAFMHMFESNPGSGLRAHEKIVIQALIGGILGIWVYRVIGASLWIPFAGTFNIGLWIIPLAILIFMATTNAVNISDGMDGLASGLALCALMCLMLISIFTYNYPQALLGASAIGSLITFVYFNIKPARVQMGDTGSFALGALLTILAFSIGKPLILLISGLPFAVEMGSTILQSVSRRIFGRRILQMAPLHHHFEMLGWSEDKVVMRFWLFAVACNMFALWLSFF